MMTVAENEKEEHWAHTDGNALWINSGTKCVLRICGLDNLKGMNPVSALVSKSLGGVSEATIIGDNIGGDDDEQSIS